MLRAIGGPLGPPALQALRGATRVSDAVRSRPWLAAAVAATLFAGALALRFLLAPYLPSSGFPFLTFFPAVLVTALLAGLWAGLAVSAASVLAAWWFFIAPAGTLLGVSRPDTIALWFFALILVVDCLVIHGMHRAVERARGAERHGAELAQQLQSRLLELERVRDDLEAALATRSRMMASVGHDLRQPLQTLRLSLQLAATEPLSPRQATSLQRAERSCTALAQAFDVLVESSALGAPNFRPAIGDFDLGALMAQVAEEFQAFADEGGVTLSVVPSVSRVSSDRQLVLGIVRNLAGNAIKYAPGGRVEVRAVPAGCDRVRVEIEDDGAGIPLDRQQAIFEEFVRLSPGSASGIGLGLALVKRSAELLGTQVELRSAPGQGACFWFELPRA